MHQLMVNIAINRYPWGWKYQIMACIMYSIFLITPPPKKTAYRCTKVSLRTPVLKNWVGRSDNRYMSSQKFYFSSLCINSSIRKAYPLQQHLDQLHGTQKYIRACRVNFVIWSVEGSCLVANLRFIKKNICFP